MVIFPLSSRLLPRPPLLTGLCCGQSDARSSHRVVSGWQCGSVGVRVPSVLFVLRGCVSGSGRRGDCRLSLEVRGGLLRSSGRFLSVCLRSELRRLRWRWVCHPAGTRGVPVQFLRLLTGGGGALHQRTGLVRVQLSELFLWESVCGLLLSPPASREPSSGPRRPARAPAAEHVPGVWLSGLI